MLALGSQSQNKIRKILYSFSKVKLLVYSSKPYFFEPFSGHVLQPHCSIISVLGINLSYWKSRYYWRIFPFPRGHFDADFVPLSI